MIRQKAGTWRSFRKISSAVIIAFCWLFGTMAGTAADAGGTHDLLRLRVFKLFRIQSLRWSSPAPAWVEAITVGGNRLLRVYPPDVLVITHSGPVLQLHLVRQSQTVAVVESVGKILLRFRPEQGLPEFLLAVPGKIERYFHGALELQVSGGDLQSVVLMDTEQLTAEVIAAEMAGAVEAAALQAQAIAARSFMATHRGRHRMEGYDFCDTTHCQFTKGSRVGSAHLAAAGATRGLVLAYGHEILQVYYSALCGGTLFTMPREAAGSTNYPRRRVDCPFCSKARGLVPSGKPIVSPFSGAANGHGAGLCQAGALEMARQGSTSREILARFFPDAELLQLSSAGLGRQ